MSGTTIILTITTTSVALVAGLFYGYSCSVNPGLHALSDKEYLAAMQSINRAILNPLFFASFMGTLILLPVSTWMNYDRTFPAEFILLLLSTIVYIIGVFGVTILGNVPLNDAIDKFQLQSASLHEITSQRSMFEVRWNFFHQIRTIASVGSLVLAVLSCIYYSK